MRDEHLAALAHRIRDLWVAEHRDFELRMTGKATNWGSRHMKSWDGGEREDGRICKPIWDKIALFVLQHNLEPQTLVRAVFYRKVGIPPTPNQALGDGALDKYTLYTAPGTRMEIMTDLIHGFESQKQRATSDVFVKKTYYRLDEATAWRVAISVKDTALTPLFRYCVARNQGWDDIAQEFEKRAVHQYTRFAELYNEVWGDWIPAELKATVAEKGGSRERATNSA